MVGTHANITGFKREDCDTPLCNSAVAGDGEILSGKENIGQANALTGTMGMMVSVCVLFLNL